MNRRFNNNDPSTTANITEDSTITTNHQQILLVARWMVLNYFHQTTLHHANFVYETTNMADCPAFEKNARRVGNSTTSHRVKSARGEEYENETSTRKIKKVKKTLISCFCAHSKKQVKKEVKVMK